MACQKRIGRKTDSGRIAETTIGRWQIQKTERIRCGGESWIHSGRWNGFEAAGDGAGI